MNTTIELSQDQHIQVIASLASDPSAQLPATRDHIRTFPFERQFNPLWEQLRNNPIAQNEVVDAIITSDIRMGRKLLLDALDHTTSIDVVSKLTDLIIAANHGKRDMEVVRPKDLLTAIKKIDPRMNPFSVAQLVFEIENSQFASNQLKRSANNVGIKGNYLVEQLLLELKAKQNPSQAISKRQDQIANGNKIFELAMSSNTQQTRTHHLARLVCSVGGLKALVEMPQILQRALIARLTSNTPSSQQSRSTQIGGR